MKRIVSVAFVLVLLLSALIVCFTSCNEPPVVPPVETPVVTPLPEKTGFDGASIHILEWTAEGEKEIGGKWIPWEEGNVDRPGQDDLGRAVYGRNLWVEAKLDVMISHDYASVDGVGGLAYDTILRNDAGSGECHYQLLTLRSIDTLPLIKEGLLADLNEYTDYLNLDKSWWSADSVRSFTMGSRLYAASSDMLLRDKGAAAAVFINQTLAADYRDLPDFFELVDDMEWTFEAMIDSCCVVQCSLDGDDDMNSSQDMWGYVADEDSLYRLYHGASRQFAHVDEQGHLAYDFGTDEGSVNDMKLIIYEFLYADDWYLDPNGNGKVFLGEGEDLFTKGKALFKDGMVKDIVTELSDMEDMYGILPFPLYDVDQETYCSLVDPYHDSLVAIPEHESRKDMCATVLEMLSSAYWPRHYTSERAQISFCLSKPNDGMKPAPDRLQTEFYVAIKEYIGCKCYQCIDMMRIISDTRSYDPGLYWDNGTGLHGEEGLPRVSSIITYDIQGLWEGFCAKVEENVREINDWIDAGESSTEIE